MKRQRGGTPDPLCYLLMATLASAGVALVGMWVVF